MCACLIKITLTYFYCNHNEKTVSKQNKIQWDETEQIKRKKMSYSNKNDF